MKTDWKMVSLFLLVRRKRTHVFSTHSLHSVCAEPVGEKQKHSWTKLKEYVYFNRSWSFTEEISAASLTGYARFVYEKCVLKNMRSCASH